MNASGGFTGTPRQVTDEVTDSPTWRGSDTLVYLSNGRLRRCPADGGGPATTIHLGLRWRRPRRPGTVVVRAGALWDGMSEHLRPDVDIVIEGGRIAEVLRGAAGGCAARGWSTRPT